MVWLEEGSLCSSEYARMRYYNYWSCYSRRKTVIKVPFDTTTDLIKATNPVKFYEYLSAGKKIVATEIPELEPFKEKVEKAEQEKIEAEIAEEKDALRCKMLKGNLFTESEIAETGIAELIESRNVSEINNLIAERYIERIDNAAAEVAEFEETSNEESVATASLETDDIADDSVSFMSKFLNGRKHN